MNRIWYWFLRKNKLTKSFVSVGDIIEVEQYGESKIYKVLKFEIVSNGSHPSKESPEDFVIVCRFGNVEREDSWIECTSDNFKYIRHID